MFFHIDYELYHEETPDIAYFQAAWRRDMPCSGWGNDLCVNSPEVNSVPNFDGKENFLMLDTKGRGHYVGCNLSVLHFQGSWWGEGDDMILIDDEEEPSINGTGAEDYFNHAWGMQKNAYPFFGTIVHESDTDGFQVSYRFHITDPVRFEKHLKVTIEHGHANHLSTAYWYQTLPTAKPITILPVEERIPNVPVLPERNLQMPELTEEMKAARESWAKRWEEYKPAREEQFRIKENKARRESKLNTEFAKKLREEYK